MLILGLGNYGREYAKTRHNAGFIVLDYFAESLGFSWLNSKPLKCELAKGNKLFLCKPTTYMNNSGFAVQSLLSYYKIATNSMLVIHDDLDLALGQVKFKFSGSSGGHNGLKSIDSLLGSDYYRVRVGIGRPEREHNDVAEHVLGCFKPDEMLIISNIAKHITDNLPLFISGSIVEFKTQLSQLRNISA